METLDNKITFSNEVEASFAILYAAIGIDGTIDKFEVEALVQAVTLKKAFRLDSAGYFEKAKNLIQIHGAPDVVKAANELLTNDLRKAVYVIAVDLVYSNDDLHEAEEKFLADLSIVFGLDSDWAKMAADTIALKYI